jgi:plastocyanin
MHLHETRPGKRAALAILALAACAAAFLLLTYGDGQRASAAASASGGSRTVTIDHFAYTPKALSVAKGTRVVFSNTSKIKHTATLRGSFDTGKISPGAAVAVRFEAPGTYSYHCTIHPEMRGKIIVG